MENHAGSIGREVIGGRYVMSRRLGRGGMGAVYLAQDLETGEQVALKQLHHPDAQNVLKLKREFRALADISHPNLVKLYELTCADGTWFFTMEYVDGSNLLTYLRYEPTMDGAPRASLTTTSGAFHDLVCGMFYQLACGVKVLHQAGKLHRDLKPSNVLVAEHRVVLLDFGLVQEVGRPDALTGDGHLWGTPTYMAPEQAAAGTLGEASDWYAVGVMLYEALTGQLPFAGSPAQILERKRAENGPAPRWIDPTIPRDLDALCTTLLRCDPAERPLGSEIIARLERRAAATSLDAFSHSTDYSLLTDAQLTQTSHTFVGRESHLEALWQAYELAQENRTLVVHVKGRSGAGKTALVERFLDQLEKPSHLPHEAPVVLRGRCYEREAVPYKALDNVMETLLRHLEHLDSVSVGHLLPGDVEILAQLFPTLTRLPAVHALLSARTAGAHDHSTRQRAAQALKQMLARLAAQQPVIVWIDDLQWGDMDSAALLQAWLKDPGPTPLLIVLSYRSDEATTNYCLQQLAASTSIQPDAAARIDLDVGELSQDELRALCRRLESYLEQREDLLERIVHEAQGSPFLASQLTVVAKAKLLRGDADVAGISLDDLVAQLHGLLTPESQRVLAVLSVAGRPIPPRLALRAAGVRRNGRSHIHALRSLHLVRMRDWLGERLLEIYHDRLRERVRAALSRESVAEIHGKLLRELEDHGRNEPEWLYVLAMGAGDHQRAIRYGLEAANRAMTALAFDRAAEIYQNCLDLQDGSDASRWELWRKLGEALSSAGRGSEAARAYLRAADGCPVKEQLLLKRIAASHLLRSGHFEEGETLVREVLAAIGANVPATDAGLTAAIAWERARLRVRGLTFTRREEHEIATATLQRIDTFHVLHIGTSTLDPLRASWFQTQQLRLALAVGEPFRVQQALCGAALAASFVRSRGAARASERLLQRAERIAQQVDTPLAQGVVAGSRAVSSFLLGNLQAVIAPSLQAERIYRAHPESSFEAGYFNRFTVASARIGAIGALGDYHRLESELAEVLSEAEATQNVSAMLHLTLTQTIMEIRRGRPEVAVDRLERQRALLPRSGRFGLLHLLHMVAMLWTAIATRRHDEGLSCLRAHWKSFVASPLYFGGSLRLTAHGIRAHLLINHHVLDGGTGLDAAVAAVRPDIAALAKLNAPIAVPFSKRYAARLAHLRGQPEAAAESWRESAERFEEAGMITEAARDRFALGCVLGGDEGQARRAAARQLLSAKGVADVDDHLATVFPELFTG